MSFGSGFKKNIQAGITRIIFWQNYPYIKRFCFEATARKQNYLGENKNSSLILLTDECYPRLEVVFGGHDNFREPMVVEADEFIAVKGFKAKGKRLTTYTIETINELEPTRQPLLTISLILLLLFAGPMHS